MATTPQSQKHCQSCCWWVALPARLRGREERRCSESLGGLVRGRGLSVSVRRTDQYVLDSLGRGGPGRARILAVSVRRTDRTFVEPDRVEWIGGRGGLALWFPSVGFSLREAHVRYQTQLFDSFQGGASLYLRPLSPPDWSSLSKNSCWVLERERRPIHSRIPSHTCGVSYAYIHIRILRIGLVVSSSHHPNITILTNKSYHIIHTIQTMNEDNNLPWPVNMLYVMKRE